MSASEEINRTLVIGRVVSNLIDEAINYMQEKGEETASTGGQLGEITLPDGRVLAIQLNILLEPRRTH